MCVHNVKPSSKGKQRYQKKNKHLWPDWNLHRYQGNTFPSNTMRPTEFFSSLFCLFVSSILCYDSVALTNKTSRTTHTPSQNTKHIKLKIWIRFEKLDCQDTALTVSGLLVSDVADSSLLQSLCLFAVKKHPH